MVARCSSAASGACSKLGGWTLARVATVSAVLLLGARPQLAAAVSVEVKDDVFVLNEETFDAALGKYPTMMIEFYAPWCGHCKALEPKYAKAAKKLKKLHPDKGMPRLAKVDATADNGKKLAEKYEVTGYPTLLVFQDGKFSHRYNGAREKADIVDYMATFTMGGIAGPILRFYNPLLAIWKEVIRTYTPFPASMRKILYTSFPAFLVMSPISLVLVLYCCFAGSQQTEKPTEPAANESKGKAESSDKAAEGPSSSSSASADKKTSKNRSASPGAVNTEKPADKKKD